MCTGNIKSLPICTRLSSVYPCVYREHIIYSLLCLPENGLSLCVQGTLININNNVFIIRFIPVCTGNTLFILSSSFLASVYPCVYREHSWCKGFWMNIYGLSLCVQGTLFNNILTVQHLRFIPVCTGNTAVWFNIYLYFPVYPCVYREHIESTGTLSLMIGLSLCVQGTLWHWSISDVYPRFIPVCTGNTGIVWNDTTLPTVYPCVYREHKINFQF